MSTKKMTNEEARVFAGLLASIDKETEKAMAPIVEGKRHGQDALSLIRRAVKAILTDKDRATRLKPTVHAKLTEWAATYGLQTRREEVFSKRRWVSLTEDMDAELLAAVGGDEKKVPEFLRVAVMARVAEVEQSKKKGRAA